MLVFEGEKDKGEGGGRGGGDVGEIGLSKKGRMLEGLVNCC